MSKRATDLLSEMMGIFGDDFGASSGGSLVESEEISEAPKPMPSRQPSKGGLLTKKKGGHAPAHGEKSGHTITKKKLLKAAGRLAKEKDAEGEKRFHGAMKDIRGEMDKSHKKSLEKKGGSSGAAATKKTAASSTKAGSEHFPFKRKANLGPGIRGHKHDETKCWKCRCGKIYSDGCDCTSSGHGAKCPDAGTKKHITYHAPYHRKYNDDYHADVAAHGPRPRGSAR